MITLIGVAIGVNAALLSVISEWLADFKLGYCKTAFYLNESFCCWGEHSSMSWPTYGYLSCMSTNCLR